MTPQPIKIAILAMGGEGGGVLADWIIDLGERNGYLAQGTSVPGVAQRTGATIYYVELFPAAAAAAAGRTPVFALMPLPGDVDIVLASELMEAGRAVQRGLVTAERTTFIASTHRVWSITEKTALGDGRVDGEALLAHARTAAARFIGFDMAATAEQAGSVISAVLFGALAGTGVLPFSRDLFEATITRGGVGVAASTRAFEAGFEAVARPSVDHRPGPAAHAESARPAAPSPVVAALLDRLRTGLPVDAHAVATEGIRRCIDWQDAGHAEMYLRRLERLRDDAAGAAPPLLAEAARHLALWMTYEDTIRVAALKTRATRFARVHGEVRAQHDQVVAIDEYLHPRLEEIVETLPPALGRWLERPGWPRRLVERLTKRGRVVTTSSLGGFLLLHAVAGLRRWRRSSARFILESARIDAWLAQVGRLASTQPALALEALYCQRLVKGYGDTHARGWKNFSTLMALVARHGPALAPATLHELRDAALADERGEALHAALCRHRLDGEPAAPPQPRPQPLAA